MRYVLAMLLACVCSGVSAQEYWAAPARCRTYSVPVANYYRVTRDLWTGYVYRREYIGTRYEQRTFCESRPRYGFEPWIQPMQPRGFSDEGRWSIDTGFGEFR